MAHYLVYWKAEGVNDPDRVLHWAAGAQIAKVEPGDVLWPVSPSASGYDLVTRIEVERVTSSEEEARAHIDGEFTRGDAYALGAREGAVPNQRIPITDVLRRLRLDGDPDTLPQAPLEITPMHLRALRRVSDESVTLLEDAWAEAAGQPRGHRNPPWERDELILALDLYVRLDRRVADETHPEVVALSRLLNELPIHAARPDAQRFRNLNGVALKLANFRAIEQPGRGMSRGNRLEQVVWDEFADDPIRLRAVASAIQAGTNEPEAAVQIDTDEEEEASIEGRLLHRIHRVRERDPKIVKRKKEQVLRTRGRLACEACDFDFGASYGERGQGFMECHHTWPFHELEGERETRLEDLVLVCSNCHRMIHRGQLITVRELKGLLHRRPAAD